MLFLKEQQLQKSDEQNNEERKSKEQNSEFTNLEKYKFRADRMLKVPAVSPFPTVGFFFELSNHTKKIAFQENAKNFKTRFNTHTVAAPLWNKYSIYLVTQFLLI